MHLYEIKPNAHVTMCVVPQAVCQFYQTDYRLISSQSVVHLIELTDCMWQFTHSDMSIWLLISYKCIFQIVNSIKWIENVIINISQLCILAIHSSYHTFGLISHESISYKNVDMRKFTAFVILLNENIS